MNLRYSIANGVPLCRSCHYKHHLGDPRILTAIIDARGREWYDELDRQSRIHCHVNKIYFALEKTTLEQYKKSLEETKVREMEAR
jgi:hypothetical protein